MNIKQTAIIIEKISFLYPSFVRDESKLREIILTWHEILEDYEFDIVMKNLKWHIKSSKFPPKISDLITQEEKRIQNIPGIEETKKKLDEQKNWRVKNPLTDEQKREMMLEILGKEWVDRFEQHKRNK